MNPLKDLNLSFSGLGDQALAAVQTFFSTVSSAGLLGYALLILLLVLSFSLFKRVFLGGGKSTFFASTDANPSEKYQDPVLAGEFFEKAQDYHQAIESYKQGHAFHQLGRIYEILKQWDDAAQFYNIAGEAEKAALMYKRAGVHLKAAACYLTCNKNLLAAEMYEKGHEYGEAAAQYEKFGKLFKAADLYKRSKDYKKAADTFRDYYLKQKMLSSNMSIEKQKQIKLAAHESGMQYVKAAQFRLAMEIFSDAGLDEQAAEAAVQAGEVEKAARYYLSAKAFEKAAKLYDAMGDRKRGRWMMAKKYQEEENFSAAAQEFERGESWVEAAEMYEKSGDQIGAGRMYHQAGDYHRSADAFLSGGDAESAAQSLEKGGRLQEASDLYVKLKQFDQAARMQELIGDYYQAARLFKEQGDADQCISYLQRVQADSKDYTKASLLLGEMFIEQGMQTAAKDCFRRIIARKAVSSLNISCYYNLARLHESEKEFEEAEKLYESILRKDYAYKDVRTRSARLKKTLETVNKKSDLKSVPLPPTRQMEVGTQGRMTRYKLIKKVGQGGMGVVYKAEDAVLKRIVAYKILPESIKENPSVLQNFLQEAQIAAALNHPNIVTIFDTGKNGPDIYITMEYIDGISLKYYLERYPSSIPQLLETMKSICRGVAYAHKKRVIHRDLKPSNVMLLHDYTVKIMDFGLAKILTETMVEKTSIKGTPLYMSPEQIVGAKVDTRSDIYSLGCTFYRMLTGRPPFSKGDIYYQHLHATAISLRSINPEISPELEKIILKCIEKKKTLRYQSVDEMISAISRLDRAAV